MKMLRVIISLLLVIAVSLSVNTIAYAQTQGNSEEPSPYVYNAEAQLRTYPANPIRLYGITASGHNHLSALQYASNLLDDYGYTNNSVISGVVVPSTFKTQLFTSSIVTTRSHGVVITEYEDGPIETTGLLLNNASEEQGYYFFYKNSVYDCAQRSYISSRDSFTNLSLIVLVGCYTALDGSDGQNLAKRFVSADAKASVGFEDSINCGQANTWTERFYEHLLEGYTVEQSVDFACVTSSIFSGLRSALIYGNEDLTI